jgi:AraC-like DNA-binding protein
MTLGKWRQQLRLMEDVRLLAEGAKVTHAAMEAGYNSPSAFISMFRRTLGTTPGLLSGRGRNQRPFVLGSPPSPLTRSVRHRRLSGFGFPGVEQEQGAKQARRANCLAPSEHSTLKHRFSVAASSRWRRSLFAGVELFRRQFFATC